MVDGSAIDSLAVTACSEERCVPGTTDSQGTFSIENLPPNTYVIDNVGYPGSDVANDSIAYSKFFEFVEVAESQAVAIDHNLVLPEMESLFVVDAGSNTLDVDSSLSITFDAGAADSEDGFDNLDVPFISQSASPPFRIGTATLPEEAWPQGGYGSSTVTKVWSFSPFELALKSGSFQLTHTLETPLTAGQSARLLYADYLECFVSEEFEEVTVTVEGSTVTAELPMLSMVLLVIE